MAKSLITGGHGFIGYYLAKLLLEEDEQVVLFDVAPESRLTKGIRDSVKIARGDLRLHIPCRGLTATRYRATSRSSLCRERNRHL